MPEELLMEVRNIVQEAVIKTISKKKKCKGAKWLSEEALQIAEKRREMTHHKPCPPLPFLKLDADSLGLSANAQVVPLETRC